MQTMGENRRRGRLIYASIKVFDKVDQYGKRKQQKSRQENRLLLTSAVGILLSQEMLFRCSNKKERKL